MEIKGLIARKGNGFQQTYYCPYCSRKELLYLWSGGHLIGIGLERWIFCPKCKRKFKIGIWGICEQELDGFKIKEELKK